MRRDIMRRRHRQYDHRYDGDGEVHDGETVRVTLADSQRARQRRASADAVANSCRALLGTGRGRSWMA
jgi:hypothetical protein